jgi:hypothetical protein
MKITIASLSVQLITNKLISIPVEDDDVEDDQIVTGSVRLKNPNLQVICTIMVDHEVQRGAMYIDNHGSAWKAYEDTKLALANNYHLDQFYHPSDLTLVSKSHSESGPL